MPASRPVNGSVCTSPAWAGLAVAAGRAAVSVSPLTTCCGFVTGLGVAGVTLGETGAGAGAGVGAGVAVGAGAGATAGVGAGGAGAGAGTDVVSVGVGAGVVAGVSVHTLPAVRR